MKLSERLKEIHESGDVGLALEGLSEQAKKLEDGIREALGWNWLDDDWPEDVRERLENLANGK